MDFENWDKQYDLPSNMCDSPPKVLKRISKGFQNSNDGE